MVELGMIVNASHRTPSARARVYDIIRKRVAILASHAGAYEIYPDPYNIKDWEMKQIMGSGGMIGAIFMNCWLMPPESHRGLNFIIRIIDYIVNLVGPAYVGISSDTDGFTDASDELRGASHSDCGPNVIRLLPSKRFRVATHGMC